MKQIDVIQLESGRFLARPEGQLGISGFSPYPWTAAVHRSEEEAREEFYQTHQGKHDNYLKSK